MCSASEEVFFIFVFYIIHFNILNKKTLLLHPDKDLTIKIYPLVNSENLGLNRIPMFLKIILTNSKNQCLNIF
jgi:hypothetical protein